MNAIKSMFCAAAVAATASSFAANEIGNDPSGIRIESIEYAKGGLNVSFSASVNPPYRVGVHRPDEYNLVRANPITFVDTNEKSVFVPGEFQDAPLFVQVYKKTPVLTPDRLTRKMSDLALKYFYLRQKRNPTSSILDTESRRIAHSTNNMSQAVLIRGGWKSLPSNGSWPKSADWFGEPIMVPCTNVVPYVIYTAE